MLAARHLLRLLLGVFVIPSLETDDCPPITQGKGSPIYPQATRGESTTMYRVFHTESDVMELNITWTRLPSPLDHSISNFSNHTVFSNSSLNASLTMRDLKVYPDYGNYNVRVCSNCTCANTTFILYLFNCVPENLPQPVQKYQRTVIAETALEATQWLYTAFVGPPGRFYYSTTWSHGSKDVCDEDDPNKSHSFNCTRTALRKLFIHCKSVHSQSYV
ncbi:hypothetical protein GBAR_LOCUS20768 [Geodia barretti]|uniref:Uncharacterized protein n=1 Tax=Geodia barretti TaxID=519541 RepID=A0AA35SX91_GEOBA|nr:hypothetical protein GBAR_LOCUS20768 [Geodia barretti]